MEKVFIIFQIILKIFLSRYSSKNKSINLFSFCIGIVISAILLNILQLVDLT